MRHIGAWAAAAVVAACGGGDSHLERLQAQADAFEAQAIRQGADSPCNGNAQCSLLFFDRVDSRGCKTWDVRPYSIVSPTAAAAEQAASQQRAAMAQYRTALAAAADPLGCPQQAPAPAPRCVANGCVP